MTQWSQQLITIWTGANVNAMVSRQVNALVGSTYAYHQASGAHTGWTVTHVPSGMAAFKAEGPNASAIARDLAEWLEGQNTLPTIPREQWGTEAGRIATLDWIAANNAAASQFGVNMRAQASEYEKRWGKTEGQFV